MTKELNLKEYQDLQDNFDMISKGIRPEGMSMDKFRYYRKMTNALLKRRLKGELIHVSTVYQLPKGHGVTYVNPTIKLYD